MPRAAWGLAVVLALAVLCRPAQAQPGPVAPSGGPPAAGDAQPLGIPPPEPGESRSRPGTLPQILGAPVGAGNAENRANVRVAGADRGDAPVPPKPAGSLDSRPGRPGEESPIRRVGALGAPLTSSDPVPAKAVEPATRREATLPAQDPVGDFLTKRSNLKEKASAPAESSSGKFGDKIGELFHGALGHCDTWFKSDHVFDGFISPVTNPFLFEDPRSLTEVRPIFMYQQIPGSQPDFKGGNIWFFGTQARLAFTDRLSLVFHKLGGISVNPGSGSVFDGGTGFAELWLGPKYTIIRNEETGTLLAGGLQFQIPTGNDSTFQNTGSLSLAPYLSYGQNFGRDFRYGSFNALATTGWSFAMNNQRSSYYYLSGHLDLDWMNNHRFYPLVEMNWLIYSSNGTSQPMGSEGRDLINFGAEARGSGMLTWAIGARYKISESAQLGGAFEIPIAGPRDIYSYRFTLDFILRY